MAGKLDDRQLLWIDIADREGVDLAGVAAAVGIDPAQLASLAQTPKRVELTESGDHIHLVMEALEPPEDAESAGGLKALLDATPARRMVDILAGRNWLVTAHAGPLAAVGRIDARTEGETKLGALDAAGFVAAIADEILVGYFELIERIERDIDHLDERALRGRPNDNVLVRIVEVRRRIALIRRVLAPHRGPFAALARPEMELHEELGQPWPGLSERLERALDAAENLRDLLLGTFEIHMGRAAQDANNVMKVLTLLSAILLPSVVLAGVMGMNFPLGFFKDTSHFWWVIAAMGTFAIAMALIARWRHWL
jgi:magnesium transporter